MKKLFFDCGTRDPSASFGVFVLRVLLGLMMFIGHGIPKIQHFAEIKDSFYVPDLFLLSHMSKAVSLMACIGCEVGLSVLLILGLATRPAAFVLGFSMVIAAFGALGNAPWFIGPGIVAAKEPALLYLIALISIIFTGAGSYSMDASISKENRQRYY